LSKKSGPAERGNQGYSARYGQRSSSPFVWEKAKKKPAEHLSDVGANSVKCAFDFWFC